MIVVIGGGAAGLSAALAAAREPEHTSQTEHHLSQAEKPHQPTPFPSEELAGKTVLLLMKNPFTGSNTSHAQGGVACAMFPGDSADSHTEDTLAAGYGLCSRDVVKVLTSEGIERVHDLLEAGWRVDRGTDGEIHPGLEAAHSHPRIIHAGGDETGRILEEDLAQLVLQNPRILVKDGVCLQDLILDEGRVTGVQVLIDREDTPELAQIAASQVILATGGAGQLYPFTTNPDGATGDGLAAALRAGAQVKDLEFYQFHPTALADSEHFLISEAVRGEGAQLFDNAGHRYMTEVDERAELAPRDVVARTNYAVMLKQGGDPVWLDARTIGEKLGKGAGDGQDAGASDGDARLAEFLARRFPSIDAHLRQQGFNWAQAPIPVTPAAHYFMGGIATDTDGRSSIPGLYAAGECACTGVHGANRLASNSLLEGLVFGYRAGIAARKACACADEKAGVAAPPVSTLPSPYGVDDGSPSASEADSTQVAGAQSTAHTDLRGFLQELMWNKVGVIRNGQDLSSACTELKGLIAQRNASLLQEISTAEDYTEAVRHIEDRNLLWTAYSVAYAALNRKESRGSHQREDYPDTSDSCGISHSYLLETKTLP